MYRQKLNIKFIFQSLSHFSSYGILIFLLLFVSGQPLTQGHIHKGNEEKARECKCCCLQLRENTNSTWSQRLACQVAKKKESGETTARIYRNCSLPNRGLSIKSLGYWINREELRFSLTINDGKGETLRTLETHDSSIHSL